MSDAKNQQAEPSMEEILASIRRIISEDTDAGKGQAAAPAAPAAAPAAPAAAAPPPPPPPPPPAPAASAPPADVLELTEMVGDDGKVTEIAEKKPSAPPPPPPATDEDDQLVSNQAANAAAGALAGLAAASRKPDIGDVRGLMGVGNGSMTLEEIVRSEMRPILKAWLDEHLPPLVERLVQREIKRITRQADEP
jgi:cell pole-organizing protein PopZ